MNSSVSLKDQIWFLRVCHHVSNVLYNVVVVVVVVAAAAAAAAAVVVHAGSSISVPPS